jgi:hypothetical protein
MIHYDKIKPTIEVTLHRLVELSEYVNSDTVDETVDWCPSQIQRPKEAVAPSGLLQVGSDGLL